MQPSIQNNISSREDISFLKDSYHILNSRFMKEREHVDEVTRTRPRDEYHRDFTRILYSSSFRRLQGKMQILGIETDAFFRNRMTHSLEVSQIARSIASQLGEIIGGDAYLNDMYLIEAAALAHDIGHPAFGHCGERILNTLSDSTRFEGNAQNFRITRTLEKKLPAQTGLNLTNRTLLAINKYLIKEERNAKKFLYTEDYNYLTHVREKCSIGRFERTLDVQIIDIADEIAYAAHDLEDALAMGYFNMDELLYELDNFKVSDSSRNKFKSFVIDQARNNAKKASTYKTIQEFSQVFRKDITSRLISLLINDIGITHVSKDKKETYGINSEKEIDFLKYGDLAHGLKKIVFNCVNRDDKVTIYERKGETIIKGLYKVYTDKIYNKGYTLLTPDFRPDHLVCLERKVIDFIAGMMDTFAISTYESLFGVKFSDIKYKG